MERLLSALGQRPNRSIPAACGGRAEMEGAYRFFNNDNVTFDKVLQPHSARTRQRVAEQKVALLVQDTTEIDLTRPEQEVAGVGALDGSRRGFLLHAMQAFTPEGTPLGTAWAEIINRTERVSHASASEKAYQNKHTPLEEKESRRWLTGMREARALAQQTPGVQCVCVADSEAAIYELFVEPRGEVPVHWLIRACQDRALETDAGHRRESVLAAPVLYRVELRIRGRQAKTAVETRGRRQHRETRQAVVEVRAATVTLRPPWRFDRQLAAVPVNVVLVREPNPPAGEPPVEWILVTTLPIDSPEQVRQVVEYYCVRWSVEVLFHDSKQYLGLQEPQVWSERSVERAHPLAWFTYSVTLLWYALHGTGHEAVPRDRPWYRGAIRPAFPEILGTLRLALWRGRYCGEARAPGEQPHSDELLQSLLYALATVR